MTLCSFSILLTNSSFAIFLFSIFTSLFVLAALLSLVAFLY
jgi:hypothetical protein